MLGGHKTGRSLSRGFKLMFLLMFFVLLIQFFTYWVFEPLSSFIGYVFEIRFFPIFALLVLIMLFSAKNIKDY